MAFRMKTFTNELKRRKDALIIGALTGMVAAYYAISQGADLTTITEAGKGLLDNMMGRSSAIEIAKYKLYGVFMFLGSTLAFFIDKYILDR
jgi:hypothetical protein